MMKLLLILLLLVGCGTDEDDPCFTDTVYTVCASDIQKSDAVITEIRETKNICTYQSWIDEGLFDCEGIDSEETNQE